MFRTVTGAGSLLLRGLGPSGLLVTRGLGGPNITLVVSVERPRQLRHRGSGPKRDQDREDLSCYFVNVRLVVVNDQVLAEPIEGEVKVCYGVDKFRVTSALPRVSRRMTNLIVSMRLIPRE